MYAVSGRELLKAVGEKRPASLRAYLSRISDVSEAQCGKESVKVQATTATRNRARRLERRKQLDQFAPSLMRMSRARLSMSRIFSAAGAGTSGTAMASSQES